MGSTDELFLRRHPFRWLRHFWIHGLVAAALIGNGIAVQGRIFRYVGPHQVWPLAMYLVAVVVLLSLCKPMRFRWQVITSLSLMGLSVFRIVAYLQTIVMGGVPSQYNPILWSFVCHWVVMGALAVLWPRVSELCFSSATAEAGEYRIAEGRGAGAVE